uniref:Uncharacterized protein n=1 Tax=Thermofilum pendens TaxID=2269 RepID=A0A7J3X969_THEPE
MVSYEEAERILKWAREKGAAIEVYFKETSHRLRIDTMYRALDASGNVVPWTRAFGSLKPADVLNSFSVRRVVVRLKDTVEELGSLKELLTRI